MTNTSMIFYFFTERYKQTTIIFLIEEVSSLKSNSITNIVYRVAATDDGQTAATTLHIKCNRSKQYTYIIQFLHIPPFHFNFWHFILSLRRHPRHNMSFNGIFHGSQWYTIHFFLYFLLCYWFYYSATEISKKSIHRSIYRHRWLYIFFSSTGSYSS